MSESVKSILSREKCAAWLKVFFGCLIGSAAYPLFLTPNHIAPGGLTGLATVLNYLFHWPVGTVSLLMNVPLFLIGWRSMGKSFVGRSLAATILFSVLIDILPLKPLTMDPLLASIFGGVMLGAGLGVIMNAGATTGGTDMAARIIHKHMQHITVGSILFVIDCLSVIAAGITIQVEYALYAFIAIFVTDRVLDAVMLGLHREKACYVISAEQDAIRRDILSMMDRGVTVLNGRGGYSGEEKPVLLCIMSAQEVSLLKSIIQRHDPRAFLFITDAHEVLGEGFKALE